MKIISCSLDIAWEDKLLNFKRVESIIEQLPFTPDIFILPEMFSTGFTMNTSVAEDSSGETLKWLKECVAKNNFAVYASMPYSDTPGKVYNRGYFVTPEGTVEHYDKRHLFRMGIENEHYTQGEEIKIVNYKGVNIALNICYDIRFPVWSRNVGNRYDVLINIANFPNPRIHLIDALARARAIENLAYCIFVNRDGNDPLCEYSPSSQAYDFKGDNCAEEFYITDCTGFKTQMLKIFINLDELKSFREKFPAWMDADRFTVL